MKRTRAVIKGTVALSGVAAVFLAGIDGAGAQILNELSVNVNGNWSDWLGVAASPTAANANSSSPTPADLTGVSFTGSFNTDRTGTGLGTIQYSVATPGNYSFSAFLDIDLDRNNVAGDTAMPRGTPATGQTWEIGAIDVDGIADDFQGNKLLNNFSSEVSPSVPTDIATAMGFNFTVPAGDTATLDLVSSPTAPSSGFYLEQNGDNGNSVYLYGSLDISSNANVSTVPDSMSTLSVLALAVAGLAGLKYKLERDRQGIV